MHRKLPNIQRQWCIANCCHIILQSIILVVHNFTEILKEKQRIFFSFWAWFKFNANTNVYRSTIKHVFTNKDTRKFEIKRGKCFFSILIQTETPSTMKKGFELFIKKRKTKIKLGARWKSVKWTQGYYRFWLRIIINKMDYGWELKLDFIWK